MSRTISLTQGYFSIVDDEDYEWLNQWKWRVLIRGEMRHAVRHNWCNGKDKTIYMHRTILDAESGRDVDHINGNGLDNRRENLRIATRAQNLLNKNVRKDSSTGIKGVKMIRDGRKKKWAAKISIGKVDIMKYFYTKEEAAQEYNNLAVQYHGDFARLNHLE